MKNARRLLIEKVLLGASSVGATLGVIVTIAGVYIGPIVTLGCIVGIVMCVRNIRKLNKASAVAKSGGTNG